MQFLTSELPCVPKSLDVALNTADVRPFDSNFEWKEQILKSVSETPYTCDALGREL